MPIFELVVLLLVGEKCRAESDVRVPAAQDGSPKRQAAELLVPGALGQSRCTQRTARGSRDVVPQIARPQT